MNIIAAIEDPGLFKPFFKDPGTWRSWETYLRALFGLEIVDGAGLKLFRDSTGLEVPPTFEEPWPSEQDAPDADPTEGLEGPPEPDPDGEIDLDPGRERRTAVQELGKATGRAMIDDMTAPKPKPLERVRGAELPSDKTWGPEIKKIFAGNR